VLQNNHFYLVLCHRETKQECVQNLKHSAYCSYMNVLLTNVSVKEQQRVFWDSYWTAILNNEYCYLVCSSAATYLYAKRDKGRVTCSAYWK
jgi:hypothetical protein